MAKTKGSSKPRPRKPARRGNQPPTTKKSSKQTRAVGPRYELGSVLKAAAAEIWEPAEIQAFVTKRVDTILEERGVPVNKIQPPRLDIAVPALEAMRYSQLRNEIAALIATSMDTRSSSNVHPSFIEILRQLTGDELAILGAMPAQESVVAIGHIHEALSQGRTRIVHRNIIPPNLALICQDRACIPAYIDNLLRLKLVNVPSGLAISEKGPYEALLKNDFCRPYFETRRKPKKYRLERSLIAITDLGERFRNACLGR